jgi:hypothetical protein
MIFTSCKKEENCNCGEYIDRDNETDAPIGLIAIKVRNDCTNNIETFIVDIEILNYAEQNDGRYCSGVW